MPVTVGDTAGFCEVDVKPLGPVHDQEFALVEFALRVAFPPMQIGPLLVGPVDDGTGLTAEVVTAVALQPSWSVTVKVYVPDVVAVATDGLCSELV